MGTANWEAKARAMVDDDINHSAIIAVWKEMLAVLIKTSLSETQQGK